MIVHVVRSIVEIQPGTGLTAPSGSEDQDQIDAILVEIRAAFSELRCVGSERFAKQGVSMTHLHVASMLEHHGTLTMSHLAELLGVSLSNATGLIDRMEESGFVERVRDQSDRRVVFVRLAEGGGDLLNNAQLLKQDLLQKILQRLDHGQLGCVREALISLRTAALDLAGDPDVAAQWHAHSH
jgi:DNA-binding MarR family transcriptional regulator